MRASIAPLILLLPLAFGAVFPAQAASAAAPGAQSIMDAMAKANAAVVGVRVKAVEGARSARTLGLNRSGSGVVIGNDGLILTIGYLMLEAEQIEVITQEGKALPAVAVGYDLASGFGLIKPLLPLRGVSPVVQGSQQSLKAGEPLMAATGSSGAGVNGGDGGVSLTRLVSQRAFSGAWEYHLDSALFTSPPVSSSGGNHSGAPLFNGKGELMGIGSLFVSDALGENNRVPGNMFVPIDLLKPILAEMQQLGSSTQSTRAWLGVTSSDQGGRIQVVRVAEGSPAEDAGIKPGTVVQAIDGVEVTTLEAFYKKLWASASPEQPLKLTVREGGEVKTIDITPQNRMLSLKKPAGI